MQYRDSRSNGAEGLCPRAIVTVPAHNEAGTLQACLSALAVQRTSHGDPLPQGTFEVVVLANNCSDGTAELARSLSPGLPYALIVQESRLPPRLSHAGGARRTVMDLAAARLRSYQRTDGVILTTDADSRVSPTWLDANLIAVAAGVDGVAGYIDPDPAEYVALGPIFMRRGRLEDAYLTALAEIDALFDPRVHDPWPNHRVASGASLAVTLDAYTAIGGLPIVPLGEDAALVRALERAGCRVRHSLDAVVTTSCRFDGRAPGGAADTMRLRHADPDAPCSDDLEPAIRALRRSVWKGRLRQLHDKSALLPIEPWADPMGIDPGGAAHIARDFANLPFAQLWEEAVGRSSALGTPRPLRPSQLSREIRRAQRLLRRFRHGAPGFPPTGGRAGTPVYEHRIEPEMA